MIFSLKIFMTIIFSDIWAGHMNHTLPKGQQQQQQQQQKQQIILNKTGRNYSRLDK